ncbi:zinc-ribbon domain-containing protein, partial [Pseudophaeobacter sp.]|uniref:zinc-ribbon domain-containing protein n=1 Tax=Pseudophaeobacter sp. TaxID=1971739 RepID=UPI002633C3E1
MRLTCPNCGAQYEVPDDVIPDEGRDVQCSNCGDTWFQQASGIAPAATADPDFAEPPAPEPAADAAPAQTATEHPDRAGQDTEVTFASEPQLDPSATSDSTAQDAADVSPTEDSPQQTQDAAAEDLAEPAPQSPPSPARGLDPALSEILREEAEREASLRAADQSQTLETQPNLGLDDLPENEEAQRSRQA